MQSIAYEKTTKSDLKFNNQKSFGIVLCSTSNDDRKQKVGFFNQIFT
jgi:hypothetical protein